MANRVYLYAHNGNKMMGIAEYKYGTPIAYMILLSKNTKMVKSKIFKQPFKIALQGDYEEGVARLYAFLDELKSKGYFDEKEIDEKISSTKAFLEEHKGTYFHLEAAETYENFPPIGNKKMLKKITDIEKAIADFYQSMDAMQNEYDSLYARMSEEERNTESGAEKLQKIKDRMMWYIGIQEWADDLYYEINTDN